MTSASARTALELTADLPVADLEDFYRDLHRHPELSLEEHRTAARLAERLKAAGFETAEGIGGTGVVGLLRNGDGPTVLLRADMDALPVEERTGLPYASKSPGVMHACGHDLHVTWLAGAAKALADGRDAWSGTLLLVGQPAEEAGGGAAAMVADGLYDRVPRPDVLLGQHAVPGPAGLYAHVPGLIMSATTDVEIVVHGRGGHGSAPHQAKDPVPVMAEMILGLQNMVTRQFNAHDPVVVSVGMVKAGEAINVIPDMAEFGASLRMYSDEARTKMQTAIPRLLKGIASAHGLEVDINYHVGGRVTVTDAAHTAFAAEQIHELFGAERHHSLPAPLGGSEDFADVLARVPGSFICLDATPLGGGPDAAFNHSPRATFDDSVLVDGTALYTQLAVARLAQLAAA